LRHIGVEAAKILETALKNVNVQLSLQVNLHWSVSDNVIILVAILATITSIGCCSSSILCAVIFKYCKSNTIESYDAKYRGGQTEEIELNEKQTKILVPSPSEYDKYWPFVNLRVFE